MASEEVDTMVMDLCLLLIPITGLLAFHITQNIMISRDYRNTLCLLIAVRSRSLQTDISHLNKTILSGGIDDSGEYDPPSPDSWIGEGSYPP